VRSDLPEFLAWALVYQAESGDHGKAPLARDATGGITNRLCRPGSKRCSVALASPDAGRTLG
jgi:hypothetical protein